VYADAAGAWPGILCNLEFQHRNRAVGNRFLYARKDVRIPVKWATYSGGKWARLGRASRRGKVMMPQVAHMGQETWGNIPIISSPSSRLRHLFFVAFR
jgi:hypothetical protein